jgi:hypothetical protein
MWQIPMLLQDQLEITGSGKIQQATRANDLRDDGGADDEYLNEVGLEDGQAD